MPSPSEINYIDAGAGPAGLYSRKPPSGTGEGTDPQRNDRALRRLSVASVVERGPELGPPDAGSGVFRVPHPL